MTDPKHLTPADVPALSGDELNRAVEWWVYGDDLTANTDEFRETAVVQWLRQRAYLDDGWIQLYWPKRTRLAYCKRHITIQQFVEDSRQMPWWGELESHVSQCRNEPRLFTTDANLCLQFWEPGGVLYMMAPPCQQGLHRTVTGEWKEFDIWKSMNGMEGETFQLATCRAAVLAAMRSKGE